MKKILLRFFALLVAASLGSPARLQSASGKVYEETAATGKFQSAWTLADPAALESAAKKLDLMEQRFKSGNASQEELMEVRAIVERIRMHAPYLVTIRSRGGSLGDFFDYVSQTGPGHTFSFINAGDPTDLETQLPPFDLRNVGWGTVIGVMDNFLQTHGLTLRFVGGDHPDPNHAKSLVCVLRRIEPSPDSKRSAQTEFGSFQLGDNIYSGQTIETIVDLIRTAWEFDPGHDAAALRLKFHPGTKILLVSGPAPAADIARQVVAALRKRTL